MSRLFMIGKVGGVFLIVTLTIGGLTPILVSKNTNTLKFEHAFYGENIESVEVGFFGGSHACNAFCPNILWREQKIRAYNYASSGQPLFLTYYVINEVLKKQKLQVAVVDLYYVGLEAEWFSSNYYVRSILDNMKMSKDWKEGVTVCVEPKIRKYHYVTRYLPFYKYHYRWSEINENDFQNGKEKKYEYNPYLLGWIGEDGKYEKEFSVLTEDKRKAEIPKKSFLYLYKIMELAKKKNVQLIFTSLPHEYVGSGVDPQWVEDEYAVYNSVEEIANKNNIPFIRFNQLRKEVGFDERVDMYNQGHVSISGAFKISRYMGKYIKNTGQLDIKKYLDTDKYYIKYNLDFEKKLQEYLH